MKLIRVAVLITVAAFSAAQNVPPGGTIANGTVEGTVINSLTGAGIGGASVALFGDQSARRQTTTDVAGHFKFTGLAPGNYRTTVEKDGFSPPMTDFSFSNPGVRVASGSDPVKAEIRLSPFNSITGRVFGPDGKPAKGVEVTAAPNVMANEVVTGDDGRFVLENTRPGSYILIARPPAGAKPEETNDGTRTAMVSTYYPSVADKSMAQQIVFGGQADFGGFEIHMQTAQVHRVRGIVLDEEGKPLPGAELALVPIPENTPGTMGLGGRPGGSIFALGMRRAPNGAPEATAIAREDGHFEFSAVRTGDWRINVVSDAGVASHGSADVRVSRGDVDDLQVHAATPFKLTGTVEWKTEGPMGPRTSNPGPLFDVLSLMNPDGNEFVTSGIIESGGVSFEGVLPGRYRVIVKPGLSAQIFLGDYEVTGQTFPVAGRSSRLRVVLRTWSGIVRGTVEKGEGATVVLFPQRAEGVTLGQTVVCGAGGSFELSDVSPGDYYIAAFDRVDRLSLSAAMLSLVPARGVGVRVEEHLAANVTLSLIATPR